jgi:hypothetical protein
LAGFAALIGGMGQPIQQYGQQVRGFMESRRENLVGVLSNLAAQETDPQLRSEYLGHLADLHGNKDLTKIIPAVDKTMQKHAQSNQAAAQMVGGPPQQPPAQPGPAGPGQVNGTVGTPLQLMQHNLPLISPPAAQPATSPAQPQSPGFGSGYQQLISEMMGRPEFGTPAGRALLDKYYSPLLSNEASLEDKRAVENMEVARKKDYVENTLKKSDYYKDLPAPLKAAWDAFASVPGQQIPQLPGMAYLPRLIANNVLGENLPPDAQIFGGGSRQTGIPYRLETNGIAGGLVAYPEAPQTTIAQTPGGIGSFNRQTGQQIAPLTGAIPPSQNASVRLPMANGMEGIGTNYDLIHGTHPLTQIPGSVVPSLLPVAHTNERTVTTYDANGVPTQEVVPFHGTTQKVLPATQPAGSPAAPSAPTPGALPPVGGRSFPKTLTNEQVIKGQQQLGQYNIAIDRMSNILKNVHLLDSMIDAGKLELQLDSSGLIRALINRTVPLTPAEAQFAGDFQTMMEDINLLRGPLGAMGFRGPEAFAALQKQRGQLLANPAITRQVLANSLKALRAQQHPLDSNPQIKSGTPTETPATPSSGATHRYNPITGRIEEIGK